MGLLMECLRGVFGWWVGFFSKFRAVKNSYCFFTISPLSSFFLLNTKSLPVFTSP